MPGVVRCEPGEVPVSEVARRSRLTKQMIRNYATAGVLQPSRKVPRGAAPAAAVFRAEDVEAFLAMTVEERRGALRFARRAASAPRRRTRKRSATSRGGGRAEPASTLEVRQMRARLTALARSVDRIAARGESAARRQGEELEHIRVEIARILGGPR